MTIRSTILSAISALAFVGAAPRRQPASDRGAEHSPRRGVRHRLLHRRARWLPGRRYPGAGGAGTPVRVEAVLAPGQSFVLSTPREAGAAPDAVEISRQDDRLLVREPAFTN